jgi:hypothetical protein
MCQPQHHTAQQRHLQTQGTAAVVNVSYDGCHAILQSVKSGVCMMPPPRRLFRHRKQTKYSMHAHELSRGRFKPAAQMGSCSSRG